MKKCWAIQSLRLIMRDHTWTQDPPSKSQIFWILWYNGWHGCFVMWHLRKIKYLISKHPQTPTRGDLKWRIHLPLQQNGPIACHYPAWSHLFWSIHHQSHQWKGIPDSECKRLKSLIEIETSHSIIQGSSHRSLSRVSGRWRIWKVYIPHLQVRLVKKLIRQALLFWAWLSPNPMCMLSWDNYWAIMMLLKQKSRIWRGISFMKHSHVRSLRAIYGTDHIRNGIYASDSSTAEREITFFFPDSEFSPHNHEINAP